MATSGVSTWTENTGQIITRAYRLSGELGSGDALSTTQLAEGMEDLNSMVKSWQTEGIRLWTRQEAEAAAVVLSSAVIGSDGKKYTCIRSHSSDATTKPITGANWSTYWVLGGNAVNAWVTSTAYTSSGDFQADADTKSIEKAFYRMNGYDYELDVIDFEKYLDITNKGNVGYPVSLVADKKLLPTVYIWPLPDNDTTIVLHYLKVRLIQDFTSDNDNADFPVAWTETLVWNLAYKRAFAAGRDLKRVQMIGIEANKLKVLAKIDDREVEDETFIRSAYGRK